MPLMFITQSIILYNYGGVFMLCLKIGNSWCTPIKSVQKANGRYFIGNAVLVEENDGNIICCDENQIIDIDLTDKKRLGKNFYRIDKS